MNNTLSIPFRRQVVRDLAWVMVSPGLLQSVPEGAALVTDEWCRELYVAGEEHLRALDENPKPLLEVLSNNKSHRLGVYFEWLLRYWLEEILHVQQLAHNVPIFQKQNSGGKRTLGEFDYLFQVHQGQSFQHWEATVKFYLQKTDEHGLPCWIGPGESDRLDKKLDRLFQHQLKLEEFPEAKACLSEMGAASVQPYGFIKGYLFCPLKEDGTFPLHQNADSALRPVRLSPLHNKGWWIHWRKQPLPISTVDARWVILLKPRWLSPARYEEKEEGLLDRAALALYCDQYFQQQGRPLLVAELHWYLGRWMEVSRGFVLAPE